MTPSVMHLSRVALCAAALASATACKRTQPETQPAQPAAQPAQPTQPAPPAQPAQATADVPAARDAAAAPTVATLRLVNASNVPLTFTTNPDLNEMVHAWRVNVADDRSDRAAMYVNDPALLTRVKLFPVDLPRCEGPLGAGFGGLGTTGQFTLAPGETRELGAWDGLQREETVDPQRGACLREMPAPAGRYRLVFDQPKQTRHNCERVLLRHPPDADAGAGPRVLEFRCVPRPDGSVDDEE